MFRRDGDTGGKPTRRAASSTSRRSRRSRSTSSATCGRRSPASRASPPTRGVSFETPTVAIRTGDTPAAERARFQREPADILITTPESLYLLLTSNAREALRRVDTIIIDEIHALVPTKRGAHLALSIERLAARCERPPQRIGLSATQRPLEEVARFLGGTEAPAGTSTAGGRQPADQGDSGRPAAGEDIDSEFSTARIVRYRPVTIVDAGAKKALRLTHRGAGRGHGHG